MNNRSEALAAVSMLAQKHSLHLRPHFPRQSGRRAFPMTDAESAWWCITLPACIRSRST